MRKFTGDMLHTFFFTAYSGTITGADIVYKFDNKETNESIKYFMTVKNDKIEKDKNFSAKKRNLFGFFA